MWAKAVKYVLTVVLTHSILQAYEIAHAQDRKMEAALQTVRSTIDHLTTKRRINNGFDVTLVAVSKLKPLSDIIRMYSLGQRHFGENFVNELVMKAQNLKDRRDIKWHFIGHLQSNKVKQLLSVENLYVVETVDSLKIAEMLDSHCLSNNRIPLRVFLQVNTSREPNKHGFLREDIAVAATSIVERFTNLQVAGLMTIGSTESSHKTPNPDFQTLIECRDELIQRLEPYGIKQLELSMGMSTDYKHAIEMGSTNVRIGSLLFGERT